MHKFKDLQIWKLAFDLSRNIYRITLNFPKEEIYGLTSQIRRASVSIFSNIAEGSGRSTNKDFRNFLFHSLGSLREVESQLLFSKDLDYLSEDEFEKLILIINELGAKISMFIRKIESTF